MNRMRRLCFLLLALAAAPAAANQPPLERIKLPLGGAFRDGALHVSAVSRILRFDGMRDAKH